MKLLHETVVISFAVLINACANPINGATSNRYSVTCAEAEQNGQLTVAEQACYRALVNVYWGHLNDSVKSQKMYNLARIKSRLDKFDEAEALYKESIAIEEKLTPVSDERIGRRLAELTAVYAAQDRFEEGLPYVERLFPLADNYQAEEKRFIAAIFYYYSQALPAQTPSGVRTRLEKKAVEMGFDPKISPDPVKMGDYQRDADAALAAQSAGNWTQAWEDSSGAYAKARAANAPDSSMAIAAYEYGRTSGVVCDFANAEKALLEAAKLDRQSGGPVFMDLVELARLNLDEDKWAQASNYFEEALAEIDKVQAKVRAPYGYADILDEYALAKRKLGNETDAAALEAEASALRAGKPKGHSITERTPYGKHCLK